jgi:TRAP-type C4-dicarboxylate transport system substrate-binding protein
MLKMVGAIPVSMSTIDAYDALQKGVLDGVQLATSSATRYKFYELCPYLTIPNFIYFNTNWGMQTKAYNSLPKDLQGIVYQLLREMAIVYTGSYVKNAETGLSKWPNKHVLTPKENQAFLEVLKPLRDKYIKDAGPKGEKMLKAAEPLYKKYYDLTYDEALKLQKTNPVRGLLD